MAEATEDITARERILVVDDDPSMRQFLSIMLSKEGYDVVTVSTGQEAIERVRAEAVDVVITDIKMPGMDGIAVLESLKKADPSLPVVIMTAYASQQTAIDALNKGAFQYLEKKAKNDDIKLVVKNALAMKRVQRENQYLKKQLKRTHGERQIVGSSPEMEKVYKFVSRVAATDSTILITGENGTGKELIAQEIHYQSPRASGPFVSINCGALPKDLLESNLFGHVKGSFTGAVRDEPGLFIVAEGGTFFLDEVGEMPLDTQVKLLRALQEREVLPVGGRRAVKIDVRLVAATNVEMEKAVAEGRFRADLYYRLNVIPLRLPALRERRSDIPMLVDHFMRRHAESDRLRTVPRDTMLLLERYPWPGNVRELENVIERAVILDENGVIDPEDLPEHLRHESPMVQRAVAADVPSLTLEQLEREYILRVLQYTKGQKKRASETLGINASTLYRKLVAYGLQDPRSHEEDRAA